MAAPSRSRPNPFFTLSSIADLAGSQEDQRKNFSGGWESRKRLAWKQEPYNYRAEIAKP
jgi:hypothetical protein